MQVMARDFFVRTSDELGEALEKQAAAEGRSVSNLIRLAISQYLRRVGAISEEQSNQFSTPAKRGRRRRKGQ